MQARAHIHPGCFQPPDFQQQVLRIDDHTIAHIAGHSGAHDA
ncbi:hypothetical protein GALL_515260 [mine drainage metagenome]|uniref:Uncharacterized protein n=1 Tax=mine drainage metagenome TaxID=410659 RepID=A0A1J5PTM6_9ZZZZ